MATMMMTLLVFKDDDGLWHVRQDRRVDDKGSLNGWKRLADSIEAALDASRLQYTHSSGKPDWAITDTTVDPERVRRFASRLQTLVPEGVTVTYTAPTGAKLDVSVAHDPSPEEHEGSEATAMAAAVARSKPVPAPAPPAVGRRPGAASLALRTALDKAEADVIETGKAVARANAAHLAAVNQRDEIKAGLEVLESAS